MNNPFINEYGTKYWKNDEGQFHREDGPAIEYAHGNKEWWINDKLHRIDGPAIESANGDKTWYINDKLHRLDGPSIEWNNKNKKWSINNYNISSINNLLS